MALVGTLTDDFSTKDTGKWTFSTGADVTGGQLVVTPSTAYPDVQSTATYDLTGSSIIVEMPSTIPAGTSSSLETWWGMESAGYANSLMFDKKVNDISAIYDVSGVGRTFPGSATYSGTDHRWMRLSESGGTVFWHTSPDRSTWTQLASQAPSFAITALTVVFGAGFGGSGEAAPGTAVYDNVNVAPGASVLRVPVQVIQVP